MFRELLLVFALIWYKKSLSLPKFYHKNNCSIGMEKQIASTAEKFCELNCPKARVKSIAKSLRCRKIFMKRFAMVS